nr:MAG TPA_asm: hypothetical protein [Caudoviricetes sp.]
MFLASNRTSSMSSFNVISIYLNYNYNSHKTHFKTYCKFL